MPLPEMYFSVDVRANGPIPGEYSLASLGCAVVGRPALVYYAELKPISDLEDPDAVKANGLTMSHLLEKGQDPHEAMRRFADWVRGVTGTTHRPVFVGFNAAFDWSFVNWYLIRFTESNPFGESALDIKSYFMGLTNEEWTNTTKQAVAREFPTERPHSHNALDDALHQAELFEKMLASRS